MINETKTWFFERININKINKPIDRLIKKKRTQINKITNKRGEITTITTEVQS